MQNLSYEKQFDLHENEPVGETHFHMNGFALRLVLRGLGNGLFRQQLSDIIQFSAMRIFVSALL